MAIRDNIKRLRELHQLSQKELAEIAGVTDKAVSTWENGTNEPRMGAIQKMADYFGILKSNIIEENGINNIGVYSQPKAVLFQNGKVIEYDDLPEEGQKELESFAQYLRLKYAKGDDSNANQI